MPHDVKKPYSELKMTRTADQADRNITVTPFRKNEGVCRLALVERACLKPGGVTAIYGLYRYVPL